MAKNHYIDNKRFEQVIRGYLEDNSAYETELVIVTGKR